MPPVSVRDLTPDRIDDLIGICSPLDPEEPGLRKGVEMRREWLRDMLSRYGAIAKIAYVNDDPVAQLMFYPEAADPSAVGTSEHSIYLHCVYNPTTCRQRMGVGRALMGDFIAQCRAGTGVCKGCRLIVADAFNTGEFLPMSEFYRKFGFKEFGAKQGPDQVGGTSTYLSVSGTELPRQRPAFSSIEDDLKRAVFFHSPTCQFHYAFASRAAKIMSEAWPEIKVRLIDKWKEPVEYARRNATWAVVNAREVREGPWNETAFREEVSRALSQRSHSLM